MDSNIFEYVVNAFKENLSSAYYIIDGEVNNLYIAPIRTPDESTIVSGSDICAVMTIYQSLLVLFPSQLSICFDIANYRFVVYYR